MDVKRAADLYAKGWTLHRIVAELGLTETTVSDQLRRAGVTIRRSGPPAHFASTDQIVELRDQGLTWNEVAKQVDMTVSGAWSRYERPGHPSRLAWAVGSRFSPMRLINTLPSAYAQPSLIILVEHPPEVSSPPPGQPPTVSPLSVVPVYFMCRAPTRTPM